MADKTLDQLAQQVGKNINYYNDTDGWLTGRDVTEAEIKGHINFLYTNELFELVQKQYPEFYRTIGKGDSWLASGTVDATATGTTLVATSSIFTNNMVNSHTPLTIYNETDDESVTISGYTDGTTVTVSAAIDTWIGDTIYVLGQEFIVGGDAYDVYSIQQVRVKYKATDTSWIQATKRDYLDYYQRGTEVANVDAPAYYQTTLKDANDSYNTTIGFFYPFDAKIEDAILLVYTERPGDMGDSTKPRIPSDLPLVSGATSWAFAKKGMDSMVSYWEGKYQQHKKQMIARYSPDQHSEIVRPRIARRYAAIKNRTI